MAKVTEVSNDVASGFYLDGKLLCVHERDEFEILLKKLGFDYEFKEDWNIDKFPEEL